MDPPPTDCGAGRPHLPSAGKSSPHPLLHVLPVTGPPSLPPGPSWVFGGRGAGESCGRGRLEKLPCVGSGFWAPVPATALTSCVALGGSLNLPGSLFYPLLMRGRIIVVILGGKGQSCHPMFPKFKGKWPQPSSNGHIGGKLPKNKIILKKQSSSGHGTWSLCNLAASAWPQPGLSLSRSPLLTETRALTTRPPLWPCTQKVSWPC